MKVLSLRFALSSLVALFSIAATANPGDTTWVQAQNDVHLDYFNDFDAAVNFPNGSVTYRKVIMVFTLGKYQCPAGSQYCGDWDYTVQNYLMTPTDTFELSRLITPYANASYPRTPWAWKQRYYFDVTDFYPYLKNNATIRLSYHNYSGGFTGNIKFAFIEGTPPRNVINIKKLWEGSFNYGDTNPIDNLVAPVSVTAPAGTQFAEMKFTVTGHGSDNAGCSEFCSKYYQVKQNGSTLQQTQIWKSDCGSNDLYPQSGTWIYNRANWCPGQQVLAVSYPFSAVTAGTNYTADVDFQTYTKSGTGSPSYILSGYMVHFGAFNKTLDASVEDILSPTDYEGYFRSNPMFGSPIIRIKNTGSTTINSVSFQYGIVGQALQSYTATGITVAPLGETIITLPQLTALTNLASGSTNQFTVSIQQVNGTADSYTINNSMQSSFVNAPLWPAQFNMIMKSNNYGTQTNWRIEDLGGNVIAQRNPTSAQTSFNDVITIPTNGAYKLIVTDAGCDGLYWWANSSSTGTGWIYTTQTDGTVIPYTNGLPAYPSSLSQDFGCGYSQYFRVNGVIATGISPVEKKFDVMINPNPFINKLTFSITVIKPQAASIKLLDVQGRVILSKNVQLLNGINSINVNELERFSKGIYTVEVSGNDFHFVKKLVKE